MRQLMKRIIIALLILVTAIVLYANKGEYFEGELIIQIKGNFRQESDIQYKIKTVEKDFLSYNLLSVEELS
jgi:hypothetical protein